MGGSGGQERDGDLPSGPNAAKSRLPLLISEDWTTFSWLFQTRDIHEFGRMHGRRAPRALRRPRSRKRSRTRWRHPAACERSDSKICRTRGGAKNHLTNHPQTAPSTAPGPPTPNEDDEESMAAPSGGQPARQRLEKWQGERGANALVRGSLPPQAANAGRARDPVHRKPCGRQNQSRKSSRACPQHGERPTSAQCPKTHL